MKTNTRITALFIASFCLIAVLIAAIWLQGRIPASTAGETRNTAAPDAKIAQPQSDRDQNRETIDLGGGITLKQFVSKSKTIRLNTIMRDGQRLITVIWSKEAKNKSGQRLTKCYWEHGKPVLGEVDEDGDGFFELLILDDESGPRQVFDQTKDGRLIPVDKDRFKKMQDDFRFVEETFKPIAEGAEKGVTKQEFGRRVEEAVEKVKKRANAERDR